MSGPLYLQSPVFDGYGDGARLDQQHNGLLAYGPYPFSPRPLWEHLPTLQSVHAPPQGDPMVGCPSAQAPQVELAGLTSARCSPQQELAELSSSQQELAELSSSQQELVEYPRAQSCPQQELAELPSSQQESVEFQTAQSSPRPELAELQITDDSGEHLEGSQQDYLSPMEELAEFQRVAGILCVYLLALRTWQKAPPEESDAALQKLERAEALVYGLLDELDDLSPFSHSLVVFFVEDMFNTDMIRRLRNSGLISGGFSDGSASYFTPPDAPTRTGSISAGSNSYATPPNAPTFAGNFSGRSTPCSTPFDASTVAGAFSAGSASFAPLNTPILT